MPEASESKRNFLTTAFTRLVEANGRLSQFTRTLIPGARVARIVHLDSVNRLAKEHKSKTPEQIKQEWVKEGAATLVFGMITALGEFGLNLYLHQQNTGLACLIYGLSATNAAETIYFGLATFIRGKLNS